MGDREWAEVVASLAAAVHESWRAGATALWAAERRREAAWLRAEHRAAAAVLRGAATGRPRDVAAAVRHCRRMALRSARHPLLAAPWDEAARTLAAAAGLDGWSATLPAARVAEMPPPRAPERSFGDASCRPTA